MTDDEEGPTYTLDAYENQIRNTVYAAYDDHEETDVHERLEGLLFEFREGYEPQVDSREALERELDALVRDAYVPANRVVEVLERKVTELEEIGSGGDEFDALLAEASEPEEPQE